MKRSDYKKGVCFQDINKPHLYYQVTEADPNSILIWAAQEDEREDFWLKQVTFEYTQLRGTRTHQRIDCNQTPRMGRAGYTKECLGNRKREGVSRPCDDRDERWL